MLTTQDQQWFGFRGELTAPESEIVDDTLDHLRDAMKESGLTPSNDDRAASLEAALVRYMIEARRT